MPAEQAKWKKNVSADQPERYIFEYQIQPGSAQPRTQFDLQIWKENVFKKEATRVQYR